MQMSTRRTATPSTATTATAGNAAATRGRSTSQGPSASNAGITVSEASPRQRGRSLVRAPRLGIRDASRGRSPAVPMPPSGSTGPLSPGNEATPQRQRALSDASSLGASFNAPDPNGILSPPAALRRASQSTENPANLSPALQRRPSHTPTAREAAEAKALGRSLEPLEAFAMLCEYNSKFQGADNKDQLTRFHCKAVPQISVRSYMAVLAKNAEFGEEGVLLGLRIAGRYCRRTKLKPSVLNVHRLLVAATVVGIKMHFDRFRSNRTVARVGALTLQELNNLEWTIFDGIDQRAVVTEQEVNNMIASSTAALAMNEGSPAMGSPQAIGSHPPRALSPMSEATSPTAAAAAHIAAIDQSPMTMNVTMTFPHAVACEAFGIARHGQLPARPPGGSPSLSPSHALAGEPSPTRRLSESVESSSFALFPDLRSPTSSAAVARRRSSVLSVDLANAQSASASGARGRGGSFISASASVNSRNTDDLQTSATT